MSSTNRSRARDSHIADYYVTPVNQIKDFLDVFYADGFRNKIDNKLVLDPCAGGDMLHPMSYPEALLSYTYERHAPEIHTIDIRADSRAEIKTNYLTSKLDYKPDVIITNPPFNLALSIIEKALVDVDENGLVIMLLRLNFFGSQSRFQFWQNYRPINAYVHSKRMRFLNGEKTGTDSVEYMHCVWLKNICPLFTKLKVI